MRRFSIVMIIAAALLFVWYLAADRMTPFTSNARVKAIVVPIVPQVSGYVSAVGVANNSIVEAGTVLAQIDQRPFQLTLEKARASIEQASQDVGAGSADVETARTRLTQAQTNLENLKVQAERIFGLERKGIVGAAKGDDARARVSNAESEVEAAKSALERAEQQLGSDGGSNPRIRSAVAALGEAELELEWATLKAPSRGVVVDLQVDEGTYAEAGKPLMTFVSGEDVWIETYLTENNLGRLKIGNPVEITLDIHPGLVIEGAVASLGGAAATGRTSKKGDLPSVQNSSGWMRDPQRFPVIIHVPGYRVGDESDDILFALNGQADVIVYTGESFVMNALGAAYIRIVSWASYAY